WGRVPKRSGTSPNPTRAAPSPPPHSRFFVWHEFCHSRAGSSGEVTAQPCGHACSVEGSFMDTPRVRARTIALACVLTVLTFAAPATGGERLVFDAFIGTRLHNPASPGDVHEPYRSAPEARRRLPPEHLRNAADGPDLA